MGGELDLERWNTHLSRSVEVNGFGLELRLAQDPASNHLGMSVWDSSIVMFKFLDRNQARGELSRKKVHNKRCLELGAGMGLSGFGMALLGAAEVVQTDQKEVLPLLRANASRARTEAFNKAVTLPPIEARELDWGNAEHAAACGPPFDFVVATDCVYSEALVAPLLQTMLHVSNSRTRIVVMNERRSLSVEEVFHREARKLFHVHRVPQAKMDPRYQHEDILLYYLKRHSDQKVAELAAAAGEASQDAAAAAPEQPGACA